MDSELLPPRTAGPDELAELQAIEVASGELFAARGMTFVSDQPPLSLERLGAYHRDGRAWVVASPDRIVAFLVADLVDGNAHVDQVSVRPAVAHRRIGRSLITHLERWADDRSLPAVTLTTFTAVPWNGPYYARCGFRPLLDEDLGPELAARRAAERVSGLDRLPRQAMIRVR